MSRGLIVALGLEIVILTALLTIAADQIAHTHVEKLGGVNVWGYRGPVLHQKKENEVRIAVTGGDLAFGWGVAASEALAPSVRQRVSLRVDVSGRPNRIVSSVTTAARGLSPSLYATWIDRYAYLRPDVICLVADPIGHALAGPVGTFLPDRRSIVFKTFGYSPILPLVLQEKGAIARSALRRLAGDALDAVDGALGDRADGDVVADADYSASIAAAVSAALRSSTGGVVVVLAPFNDNRSVKARLASAVARERVRLVDLRDDPRMLYPGLRLDGFSFSVAGHAVAAESVAAAAIELIERAGLGAP
jgi:hypothetical protein